MAEGVLRPYIDSAGMMRDPAVKLSRVVDQAKNEKDLPEAIAKLEEKFKEFTQPFANNPVDFVSAKKKIAELRAENKNSQLTEKSKQVIDSLLTYVESTYDRFHYLNKVGKVRQNALETVAALKNQFAGNSEAITIIGKWERELSQWKKSQSDDSAAIANKDDKSYADLLGQFSKDKESSGLIDHHKKTLATAIDEMSSAPWVLRDAKKTNMTGWRAEQLTGLV
jgi:hypothetical protein